MVLVLAGDSALCSELIEVLGDASELLWQSLSGDEEVGDEERDGFFGSNSNKIPSEAFEFLGDSSLIFAESLSGERS